MRRPVVKVRHSGRYHDRHRRLALRFHPLSDHGRRHRPLYQEIIKRDAGLYPSLEKLGFLLNFGDDQSGLDISN
ncbi:MAG: hypothetical protein NTW75_09165 [Planctomycetales bacterium]|nr:hypothetical protein [Planctomycetales bacterium]